MKSITEQATNKVSIVGKLLECTFSQGKTNGRAYERANLVVRVTQTYNGTTETSEIPISLFASQYTSRGTPHPGYKNLQDLKKCKSIQNFGEAEASTVRITNGSLSENYFVSNTTGQVINTWQVTTSFINETSSPAAQIATFNNDIFIMDMHDEVDREGDPTGHLIIKGGLVQYGGKLDVVEFVVEGADAVDYIQRSWEVNDTVNVGGRIRFTSKEESSAGSGSESTWGEALPVTTTRVVRQLIITRGSNEAFDEEFAYDPVEIKKAFNERKARIEQRQIDAQHGQKSAAASTSSQNTNRYSWE